MELKPCPFCGSKKVDVYDCVSEVFPEGKPAYWSVICEKCDAQVFGTLKKVAVKKWNTRAER